MICAFHRYPFQQPGKVPSIPSILLEPQIYLHIVRLILFYFYSYFFPLFVRFFKCSGHLIQIFLQGADQFLYDNWFGQEPIHTVFQCFFLSSSNAFAVMAKMLIPASTGSFRARICLNLANSSHQGISDI